MGRLLSGRVGVTSFSGLSTERQQTNGFPSFLGLEETEPNLGLPADNDYVLHGDVNGRRFWAAPSGGGGGGGGGNSGISVQEQGITASGYAGSTTTLNFSGNGVTVDEVKVTQGGAEIGISTITINRANLNIQDESLFTRVTGVSTVRVGSGLSFVEVPTGQFNSGIVSIFTDVDSKTDFQDPSGNDSFQDITIIRIGAGLTITQPGVGIASIRPTGDLEFLNVSGIASAPIFDGNLQGNVTGNITGNISGNLTGGSVGTHTGPVVGDVTGSLTGDINSGISTITQLEAGTVTATNGFSGSLNSGISTVTNFFATNIKATGITTSPSFVGDLTGNVNGTLTGTVNSTGINTLTTVSGTTATYTSFVGTLTGASSLVDLTAESSDSTCNILLSSIPTGSQSVKTSTQLTFDSVSGIVTATGFAGDGSRLTNIDASSLTGALSNVDGSALTNIVSSSVDVTATNTTNADHFILFADSATGVEPLRSDTDLKYNPGTNTLTAGVFNGSATGLSGDPDIAVTDITLKGNLLPDVNGIRDLGSSTLRFQNIYTSDMHFSNEGGQNSVDGTWGHWTMQEGETDMFLLNQRTGKKYKINLTEV